MGKSLVIKGADFSANGIPQTTPTLVWYINECRSTIQSGSLNNAKLANGGWCFTDANNSLLQGKTINRIKFVPSQAGIINFYKSSSRSGPVTLVASLTVLAAHIGEVTEYELEEFTLGGAEYFIIGQANSAGGFKYYQNGDASFTLSGFYSRVPSNPNPTHPAGETLSQVDLNISVGYYGYIDES